MDFYWLRLLKIAPLAMLLTLTIPVRAGAQSAAPSQSPTPSNGPSLTAPPPPPSSTLVRKKPELAKDWAVAEEFDFDWRENGAPAHFKIEQSQEEQISRLTISFKGEPGRGLVLENDDVWEEFARDFLKEEDFLRKNKNLAASKYVFSFALAPSAKPLVFLVTPQYGSDPGNLFVLALDSREHPKLIMNKTLHLKEIRDLDGDGMAEIAAQPCFSQSWSSNLLTYDPLHVYKLETTPEPKLELSLALSQDYNQKHYYGWAGPECSEGLAVVLHPPGGGKPVIMKTEEAKKMLGKKK